MAALQKITGRRVENVALDIPNPSPQGFSPLTVPPPVAPPPRKPQDSWIYYGGPVYTERTISISVLGSYWDFIGYFNGSQQIGAWRYSTILLYPDWHPLARTIIPEWDYFNW